MHMQKRCTSMTVQSSSLSHEILRYNWSYFHYSEQIFYKSMYSSERDSVTEWKIIFHADLKPHTYNKAPAFLTENQQKRSERCSWLSFIWQQCRLIILGRVSLVHSVLGDCWWWLSNVRNNAEERAVQIAMQGWHS